MHSPTTAGKLGIALAAALPLAWSPAPAHAAALKQFLANVNAGQETAANGSNAFGVAHCTYDETDSTSANYKKLCCNISYSGLSSAETVAHIHGPAVPGVAGGLLFTLPAGSPKNNACVGPLDSTQKSELLHNLLYMNIHTTANVGGEIRGQILRIK